MGGVAVGLVYQCKTLLVGESANQEVQNRIHSLVEEDQAVEDVTDLLTMHLGPQDVLLNLKVRFRSGLSTGELGKAVDRLTRQIRDRHPEVKKMFLEPSAGEGDQLPPSKGGGAPTEHALPPAS